MTRFWREGFWRTSVNGLTHWVEGHWVDRDDWSRDSYPFPENVYFRTRLDEAGALRAAAARFVNPNAKCPVCGAPVFYYQNEFGSRVYFDDLGPPWPKHSCTDVQSSSVRSSMLEDLTFIEPHTRSDSDISAIQEWLDGAVIDPEFSFEWAHGTKPWAATRIVKRLRGSDGVYLILKPLQTEVSKKIFLACRSLPKQLREGSVTMIKKNTISFVHPRSLEPTHIPIKRIKSASAFIEALTSGEREL